MLGRQSLSVVPKVDDPRPTRFIMAHRRPRIIQPRRTIWEHAVALRRSDPWLKVTVSGGILVADGLLRPQPGMREYHVRIDYRERYTPKTQVLNPQPARRDQEQPVPHTLGQDHLPCLFTTGDWNSSMPLGDTIVPWLAEWLVFYEGWRLTGIWYGNGVLPDGDDLIPGFHELTQ